MFEGGACAGRAAGERPRGAISTNILDFRVRVLDSESMGRNYLNQGVICLSYLESMAPLYGAYKRLLMRMVLI